MSISIQNRQKCHPVDTARLRRSLRRLLRQLERPEGEISVLLVDDPTIREYNRAYLQRDRPTNVISFPMNEGEFGELHPELLGDVVISTETAARDAAAAKIGFMDELEFLMIHGLLHLTGYNHEDVAPSVAETMKQKERELFFLLRGYRIE